MFSKAMFGPPNKTHFWVNFLYLLFGPSTLSHLYFNFSFISFWPQSHQFISFRPLFRQFTILSLILLNFRVSRFHVSHLTRETVKLCLQNTLNMSKTTRVYFGVLQFSPPYKNFVLEIHTLACACSISDPFFSCLLQKLERDFHLSHQTPSELHLLS